MRILEGVKASKKFLKAWVDLNNELGDMEDKFSEKGNKKAVELILKIQKTLHATDKLLDGFSNMIKYD